ncbi:MAG TPA: ABC transporter substrate-binding protein [Chloroflexota bacterium]|nr:ABC transporter substrate-binding protein [Chloroflexota bacterium]
MRRPWADRIRLRAATVAALIVLVAGCQSAPTGPPGQRAPAGGEPQPSRNLVMLIRVEPASLASKSLQQAGTILTSTRRLFNATLGLLDDHGEVIPYLAAELPRLNTATWKVFPDGRMETTYTLRPALTWHDGSPLDAEDFVFSYRVYSAPDLGLATGAPQNLIEDVVAEDARTVIIRWRQSYANAGLLTEDFPPLPRHILQDSFDGRAAPDAFSGDAFWTRDYVGAGPYRLERWEPGAFIESVAFDGHVLGRPRIDRITIRWSSDPNASLAVMLAGDAQLSADSSLQFQQGLLLKNQWTSQKAGTVLFKPDLFRGAAVQLRPELTTPRALLDARVRRALAFAVDKQTLNDVQFEGNGFMADGIIPPTVWYGADLDRAVQKYPLDTRKSEALMADAGFTKGADGVYASPTDGRFAPEVRTNASAFFEAEMSTLASGWRGAGFDFTEYVNPAALVQDAQVRATFPGLFIFSQGLGEAALVDYNSAGIPRPENRWVGSNRGGWSNPDFDRLAETVNTTLDRTERAQTFVAMQRIFSEELPVIPLYFQPSVTGFVSGLVGPGNVPPDTAINWNVYTWEFR